MIMQQAALSRGEFVEAAIFKCGKLSCPVLLPTAHSITDVGAGSPCRSDYSLADASNAAIAASRRAISAAHGSRVEKKYLAATKVFDTYFDSGENLAMPWQAYNIGCFV